MQKITQSNIVRLGYLKAPTWLRNSHNSPGLCYVGERYIKKDYLS